MAIVKMKRLRVIAMASCREELLRQLQRLGCVEIREPESAGADWSGLLERERSRLAETRAALADVNAALSAVKKYADVREGMFPQRQAVTQTEFLSGTAADRARAASARVSELVQTAESFKNGEGSRKTVSVGEGADIGVCIGLWVDGTSEIVLHIDITAYIGQERADRTGALRLVVIQIIDLLPYLMVMLHSVIHALFHAPDCAGSFLCLDVSGQQKPDESDKVSFRHGVSCFKFSVQRYGSDRQRTRKWKNTAPHCMIIIQSVV